jgi:hypothetical protein
MELHALGGMDEGIEFLADVVSGGREGFSTSTATLGQAMGGALAGERVAMYNKTHPSSLGQFGQGIAGAVSSVVPGGSIIQNLVPGVSPYKDQTGLPFWAQELLHLMNIYGKETSKYTAKSERRGYMKAEQ